MLNPYCTLSILSSGGGDKPDSKRSPFVFHHNCLFYPLAIQPTGYFKPHPKKQILLQSCQAIFFFPLQGTCSAQSLTALASILFIYSIYSCKRNSLNYEKS